MPALGWVGIVRLGLVQTALGAIVVLTTSTINRVMVVELGLAAAIPGLLVGMHYAIQLLRPRWGHGSDVGGRRTPWILGGMAVLTTGGFLAAVATAVMETSLAAGLVLAVVAFLMIGVGVGAAGTSLLVLLAKRVAPERRAAAATIVWVMMIFGFIVTAATAGHYLDPFTTGRLVLVSGVVSLIAMLVAMIAVAGVEGSVGAAGVGANGGARTAVAQAATSMRDTAEAQHKTPFMAALREVWREDEARRFTIFVFVSMLAYSAQDLILEPYAGAVFAFTPGQSTQLAGTQHGGVLAGMIGVAAIATLAKGTILASLRLWTVVGCLASAAALASLAAAGQIGPDWPLSSSVFLLGLANGAFAVAAIGSMMARAGRGASSREGVRMGLWGAAQAIAFGAGGLTGAVLVDLAGLVTASDADAYGLVFCGEALLFLAAALIALRIAPVEAVGGGAARPRVDAVAENMLAR
ncbi:MAG: BCD family MFS transporter [Hyphomicrobiaceae bacterium]|nr:BCD family MFS transporter [Hyphomicrobiaceae bacterium]